MVRWRKWRSWSTGSPAGPAGSPSSSSRMWRTPHRPGTRSQTQVRTNIHSSLVLATSVGYRYSLPASKTLFVYRYLPIGLRPQNVSDPKVLLSCRALRKSPLRPTHPRSKFFPPVFPTSSLRPFRAMIFILHSCLGVFDNVSRATRKQTIPSLLPT